MRSYTIVFTFIHRIHGCAPFSEGSERVKKLAKPEGDFLIDKPERLKANLFRSFVNQACRAYILIAGDKRSGIPGFI